MPAAGRARRGRRSRVAVAITLGVLLSALPHIVDSAPAPATFAEVASPDQDDIFTLDRRTLGAGVIVHPSGLALTTARVIRAAPALDAVLLDGRRLPTTVVGVDDRTDIAVLKLAGGATPFPYLRFADSDRVRGGDWVIAVGSPYGLEGSVTAGIALLDRGRVSRAWLGIAVQPLTPDLAQAFGAPDAVGMLVADVAPNSPAALAGLRTGDIVRALGGKRIESRFGLGKILDDFKPGQQVPVKLWQRGRETTVTVTLEEEPDPDAAGSVWTRARQVLGVDVRSITSDMGVVIERVEAGGAAARAGAQHDDIIREVNHRRVRSIEDLDDALRSIQPGARIPVLLQRGAASLYMLFTRRDR